MLYRTFPHTSSQSISDTPQATESLISGDEVHVTFPSKRIIVWRVRSPSETFTPTLVGPSFGLRISITPSWPHHSSPRLSYLMFLMECKGWYTYFENHYCFVHMLIHQNITFNSYLRFSFFSRAVLQLYFLPVEVLGQAEFPGKLRR